ncbi:hypothetical protein BD626DRAFT_368646, partial [Schizophyllum amplum]
SLPSIFMVPTNHPLAYIEWFTPFGPKDHDSGLYSIKPSTRNRGVYGEIIEIDHIVRNCHVVPRMGTGPSPDMHHS